MPSKPALSIDVQGAEFKPTTVSQGSSHVTVSLDFVLDPQASHLNLFLQPRNSAPSFTDCRKS